MKKSKDFHTDDLVPEEPITRLMKAVVIHAMRGTAAGNSADAFWLISKDSEEYLDTAEITHTAMLRWVAKALVDTTTLKG